MCDNCGKPLNPDENYYCASCTEEMLGKDPAYDMTGEDYG